MLYKMLGGEIDVGVAAGSGIGATDSGIGTAAGRNKSALVREALTRYMEDQEDIMLAEAALRNLGDGKTLTHEEARRALGLAD